MCLYTRCTLDIQGLELQTVVSWELNPHSLEEQPVLLTSEQSPSRGYNSLSKSFWFFETESLITQASFWVAKASSDPPVSVSQVLESWVYSVPGFLFMLILLVALQIDGQ